MQFFIYSIYDPETESFDTRLNLGPLNPKDMAEQYRRAALKMDDTNKKFMAGKKAIFMGTFDDMTGKITQEKELTEIYSFEGLVQTEEGIKGVETAEAKDA